MPVYGASRTFGSAVCRLREKADARIFHERPTKKGADQPKNHEEQQKEDGVSIVLPLDGASEEARFFPSHSIKKALDNGY